MPKRPTKTSSSEPVSDPKDKSKQPSAASQMALIFRETRAVMKTETFHKACGVLLACFTVYFAISFISYFFTGATDYGTLQESLSGKELNDAIQNQGGVVGARLQHRFIDQGFGIATAAVIAFLGYLSVWLFRPAKVTLYKVALHCAYWLLYGSVLAAFLQSTFRATGMFFRWGGAHGEWVLDMSLGSVAWVGTLLILACVLFVYMVIVNRNTPAILERLALRFLNLFRRKKNVAEELPQEGNEHVLPDEEKRDEDDFLVLDQPDDQPADNTLNLTPEGEMQPAEQPAAGGEITLQIEEQPTAPLVEEEPAVEPEPADPKPEPEPEKPLTIEKVTVTETVDENDPEAWLKKLGPYDPRKDLEDYKFPSLDLLKVYDNENAPVIDREEQQANANRIVTALRNYGVEIDTIKATVGPTVTLYEVVPKAGVKVAKIQSLEADIMMTLAAKGIRIIAPMPGKGTVGIEVPNATPQTVSMHSVIASKRFQDEKKMRLPIALGRTITNDIFMFDLAKTPHLLVAGATGQGKSVAINAIITSLLYKKHPAEMKMVLVDPKMVEFAPYKPLLKHYLAAMPDTEERDIIITDCSKVIDTLNSLVIEMENRYTLLMDAGVRNLEDYNDKFISRRLNPEKVVGTNLHHQYLPYIVIVIDEYGDFIMQAGKQVETPIARITQKARAVGMHMILATQRPSVNIVTGVIKANIPTRIALRTQSLIDSRTVLDAKGAEQLIGRGDLLYAGSGEIIRVQCAFVDTPEVDAIVEHVEHQQGYFAPYELPEYVGEGGDAEALAPGSVDLKKLDPMFAEVARYVVMNQQGSTSVLQRRFEIGYNRAGKLSDQLEAAGIVGPAKGPKGRDVLIQDDMQLQEVFQRLNLM